MAAGGRGTTRFLVDAMLGSLARKLRAFGFDSTYHGRGSDAGILSDISRQGRVLVTADRQLAARAWKLGLSSLLVTGESDRARLATMMRAAGDVGLRLKRGEPRCSLCNSKLDRITMSKARGRVPGSVARRHRVFRECPNCGQLYWKGGHWKQLRRLEALLNPRS